MPVTEIAKKRKSGWIHFHCIHQYPVELGEILSMCGLKPEAGNLQAITRSQAVSVLARELHKEPAYDTVLLNIEVAKNLAARFVDEFADETSRFFTARAGTRLTESIWDGGILIEAGQGNYT